MSAYSVAAARALAEEVRLLDDTPERVAARLGSNPAALARRFYRAGMREEARPFSRIAQKRRVR